MRNPVELRIGLRDTLSQLKLRKTHGIIGLYKRARLSFFRRVELDVRRTPDARLPKIIGEIFLADAILQVPDFGPVILDVIHEDQFQKRLIRSEVELMMDLIDDRPDQLKHSDADIFDLAGFLRRFLGGTAKGVRRHGRQFSIKTSGLGGIRSGPVDGAKQNTNASGTDWQH